MPATNAANGLFFSFAEMEKEVINMALIASKYLENEYDDSQGIIKGWLMQLKNFQTNQPGSALEWKIPIERPIRTKLSKGKYEPGGNGKHSVYATVSSKWEIAIPASTGRASKKGSPQSHFEVVGIASTRVSVFAHQEDADPYELARWRFEIGSSDSPGCHFHAQILGDDEDCIFPKSLSVPRLPNMLFTPMDALEFVLAELFQNEWAQHVAKDKDEIRNWAGCQKKRLIKLLNWQQERIEKSSGSPWTSLKASKPDPKLMVGAG